MIVTADAVIFSPNCSTDGVLEDWPQSDIPLHSPHSPQKCKYACDVSAINASAYRLLGRPIIFTARHYAGAVYAMAPCPSMSVSVCLSQVGVLLKRLNTKWTIIYSNLWGQRKDAHKSAFCVVPCSHLSWPTAALDLWYTMLSMLWNTQMFSLFAYFLTSAHLLVPQWMCSMAVLAIYQPLSDVMSSRIGDTHKIHVAYGVVRMNVDAGTGTLLLRGYAL